MVGQVAGMPLGVYMLRTDGLRAMNRLRVGN